MLTKQHFEAIAKIINARLETTNDVEVMKLTTELGEYFVTTNGLFNYYRFQDAVGIYQGKATRNVAGSPRLK